MKTTLTIFFLISFCSAFSQNTANSNDLKPYYFVLLKKGPQRDQDSITAAKIQKAHLENINKLAAKGVLNVAGPFLDDGDLRGVFIFNLTEEEQVRKYVDNDPAIKSGRLIYEIHPWMTQKGTCFK
jgi:uncharacterized protein YciI